MSKLNIHIEGPESAMEALNRNTKKMMDADLCAPFCAVTGMIIGSLVSAFGKDEADIIFAEMVSATALLQAGFDDDDGNGPKPSPKVPMLPVGGMFK